MTESAAGERLVLPRRSQAWRGFHGWALFGVLGWIAGISCLVDGEPWFGLFFLVVPSAGWLLWVRGFMRHEDRVRLAVDASGVALLRDGEPVESVGWSDLTRVEFGSGGRFTNWGIYGVGILGSVVCHDSRKRDRWDPAGDIGLALELPVFGRRGLQHIDDALRAACAEHGVEYRSGWWWTWRLSFRPSNWRPGARTSVARRRVPRRAPSSRPAPRQR